jgi:hypothetical protein
MEGTRGGEGMGTKKRGERDGVWMGSLETNKQTRNLEQEERGGTDGGGRGRGPGTRKRTKEATEQAVNDGSGFLNPYPRIKRMRVGVLGHKNPTTAASRQGSRVARTAEPSDLRARRMRQDRTNGKIGKKRTEDGIETS